MRISNTEISQENRGLQDQFACFRMQCLRNLSLLGFCLLSIYNAITLPCCSDLLTVTCIIVQVTSSGKKISDGYHTELPVQTFNTTVSREGSFILLRHDLGLEIICDVEHYLCTFNIARWYHGRMAG